MNAFLEASRPAQFAVIAVPLAAVVVWLIVGWVRSQPDRTPHPRAQHQE